jgi:hypothetical protein
VNRDEMEDGRWYENRRESYRQRERERLAAQDVACDGCGEMFAPTDLRDCEERGQLCEECRSPAHVPCGWHGCTNTTTYDDTYGDLCHQHIRAENE